MSCVLAGCNGTGMPQVDANKAHQEWSNMHDPRIVTKALHVPCGLGAMGKDVEALLVMQATYY